MRSIILFILVYLVFLLQAVILPVLSMGGLGINLFIVFIVVLALFRPTAEVVFWSLVTGFLADYLSASRVSSSVLIIPLIAIAVHYGVKEFSRKPTLATGAAMVGISLLAFALVSDMASFLLAGINFKFEILNLKFIASLLLNCMIATPVFYLLLKRLQELFEYWETRKKFQI